MCAADDQGRTRRRRHAYQAILISLCTCELCQDPVRCGSVRGMRGLVHLVRCRCSRVRIRMNKMRRPWMSSYRQQAPVASICGRVRCARAVERCPRDGRCVPATPPFETKRFHHRDRATGVAVTSPVRPQLSDPGGPGRRSGFPHSAIRSANKYSKWK
jgi:hypothetical protein